MELTVSGAFIHRVIDLAKKDRAASRDLARDWLDRLKKEQVRDYLLTDDVAEALLTERLHKDPETTLSDLEALAEGKAVRARKAPAGKPAVKPAGKKAAAPKTAVKKKAKKAPPKGRKRHRFTAAQNARAKERILAHLEAHPWSNRAALMDVGGIPTDAIYQRLIAELLADGAIVKKGTRSRTVYARAGAAAKAAGQPAAKAPGKKLPPPKLRKGGRGKVQAKATA